MLGMYKTLSFSEYKNSENWYLAINYNYKGRNLNDKFFPYKYQTIYKFPLLRFQSGLLYVLIAKLIQQVGAEQCQAQAKLD